MISGGAWIGSDDREPRNSSLQAKASIAGIRYGPKSFAVFVLAVAALWLSLCYEMTRFCMLGGGGKMLETF